MASYILDRAHEIVGDAVNPGDLVVDATVGNGWDTLFLARCVGREGRVVGMDVQVSALEAARNRLAAAGVDTWCSLHLQSHDDPATWLPAGDERRVSAAMYNLGYLPGGDKSIATRPDSTVNSLDRMIHLLAPGGLISIVAYRGHPGALDEFVAVENWTHSLSPDDYSSLRIDDPEGPGHAPVLFVIRKR
jgi:predicted methyltransferase